MIKIDKTEVYGWEAAVRGCRNPKNSWELSDSIYCYGDWCYFDEEPCKKCIMKTPDGECDNRDINPVFVIGSRDLKLMETLSAAGDDHGKFLRMINVTADITAPLYWWKEYDTYKVGTVANSCSTMHKIHSKPIEESDFSMDNFTVEDGTPAEVELRDMFINAIEDCETLRRMYLATGEKKYWRGLIQLLPEGYNQKRTVQLNYAVLKNIYHARKGHKLDEWRDFCKWIENLPYSEIITFDAQKKGGDSK